MPNVTEPSRANNSSSQRLHCPRAASDGCSTASEAVAGPAVAPSKQAPGRRMDESDDLARRRWCRHCRRSDRDRVHRGLRPHFDRCTQPLDRGQLAVRRLATKGFGPSRAEKHLSA